MFDSDSVFFFVSILFRLKRKGLTSAFFPWVGRDLIVHRCGFEYCVWYMCINNLFIYLKKKRRIEEEEEQDKFKTKQHQLIWNVYQLQLIKINLIWIHVRDKNNPQKHKHQTKRQILDKQNLIDDSRNGINTTEQYGQHGNR